MITYEEAKRNPMTRQKFLEEIDFMKYRPFIENIFHAKEIKNKRIMTTVRRDLSDFLTGLPSQIYVSDYAFNTLTEPEFYNMLIHHEGVHAMQNYFDSKKEESPWIKINFEDGKKLICSALGIRQEIEAHQNQINHPTFQNCSKEFQNEVSTWLKTYKYALSILNDFNSK